jgi:energy-coupling factor transport system ATP-binding protein
VEKKYRGRNVAKIGIENLEFTYAGADTPALRDVNIEIAQGEFLLLTGASGSGKTTLLRHLMPALTPAGERGGSVLYDGVPVSDLPPREQAAKIGFVLQNPESQIVTDKVWHELAFGLENLGTPKAEIRLRVSEMASYFGIESWYHRDTHELSGGEKQILSLAAIMTMQPDVLILDEPTAQLDPINAVDFLLTLNKINKDIGTTIIISEHRLEDAMPIADRVLVMAGGRVSYEGTPSEIGLLLASSGDPMLAAMPTPVRAFIGLAETGEALSSPVTVREGRKFLESLVAASPGRAPKGSPADAAANSANAHFGKGGLPRPTPILTIVNTYFRYEKNAADVLKNLSLEAKKGEILAILGGNGAGKTTVLSLIAGLQKPYRGKIKTNERIALLPQDPKTLWTQKTIREELKSPLAAPVIAGLTRPVPGVPLHAPVNPSLILQNIISQTEIDPLLDRHPYDVSAGEQQRVALAKLLLTEPTLLLLDEPTSGIDSFYKEKLAKILRDLAANGTTIILVSHDIEFCASYADRCALLFDGSIVSQGTAREFFSGNSFYTTAANRMSRHITHGLITVEDIIAAFKEKGGSK